MPCSAERTVEASAEGMLAASIHVKRKELDRDEEKKVRVPLKGPHFFCSQAGTTESSVTNVLPRRSTVYRHFFICVKF